MTGGVWIASYVLLWIAVMVLSVVVVALLRQVGVLHARVRPLGVNMGGEGPEPGVPAPPVPGAPYEGAAVTLVAFTSPTCDICRTLVPSLRALRGQYRDVRVTVVDHGPGTERVFSAFGVRSTPYVVAVDGQGVVTGGGIANSLEQVEMLLEGALHQIQHRDVE